MSPENPLPSSDTFNPGAYFAARIAETLNRYRADEGKEPFPQTDIDFAVTRMRQEAEAVLGKEIGSVSQKELDAWFDSDEAVKKLAAMERARAGVLDSAESVIVDKGGLVRGASPDAGLRKRLREEGETMGQEL